MTENSQEPRISPGRFIRVHLLRLLVALALVVAGILLLLHAPSLSKWLGNMLQVSALLPFS